MGVRKPIGVRAVPVDRRGRDVKLDRVLRQSVGMQGRPMQDSASATNSTPDPASEEQ